MKGEDCICCSTEIGYIERWRIGEFNGIGGGNKKRDFNMNLAQRGLDTDLVNWEFWEGVKIDTF